VPAATKPAPNRLHYEAGWTESGINRRCLHKHLTIPEAVACASVQGAGWYVFAIENRTGRQLTETEEDLVNKLRLDI
jgi:hypothetical protein